MLFGSRILALAASLAICLGIPATTSALSLAELIVPGASFDADNGTTFSNFAVKIKGRGLSRNLSDYLIVPTSDGFELAGEFNNDPKGGKIKLTYEVAGLDLRGAALEMPVNSGLEGYVAIKEAVFGRKKLARLYISTKRGLTSDEAMFEALSTLAVRSKIRIRGDYFQNGSNAVIDSSVTATFVPEPTTALMLAGGLGGLAAAGRRRSR